MDNAKFVTGSTLKHVLVMTATGSIGLVAVFIVDALSLFYISLLKQQELTAAVGYASTLLFFNLSVGIGLAVASTALTSRAIGNGDKDKANRTAGSSLLIVLVVSVLLTVLLYPFLEYLTALIGAKGETARLALRFMRIVLPSVPLLALGMCLGGLLRSTGDAKRAMWVTLGPAAVITVVDPLLIFGLGLELDGAAYAVVIARIAMVTIGLYGLLRIHKLYERPSIKSALTDLKPFMAIGIPAILTQIATPFANAFVTSSMASYGDDAVAGWAIVSRIIPVAFGVIFALSGSVGPIIGQNLGAGRIDRVRSTVKDSLKISLVYCLFTWLLLALTSEQIATAFGAHTQAREVIVFFCIFIAGTFVFNAAMFVANAAFNNLGFALYSAAINWGRATIGVIPFITLGGYWYGAKGVMAGYGLGAVVFGLVSAWLCTKVLSELEVSQAIAS